MLKYMLKGKEPVPVEDVIEWGRWFEDADRSVASTVLENGVRVSTVFLGLDHNFGSGEPVLFETMIFGGKHDKYQERYATWGEAEAGHKQAVEFTHNKSNRGG